MVKPKNPNASPLVRSTIRLLARSGADREAHLHGTRSGSVRLPWCAPRFGKQRLCRSASGAKCAEDRAQRIGDDICHPRLAIRQITLQNLDREAYQRTE